MILVDIDGTISPTRPEEDGILEDLLPVEERRAGGFQIIIPEYILDFLRTAPNLYMLSTWGEMAKDVPEAFGFKAEVLNMSDYTDASGIEGKWDVVSHFDDDVEAWLDDHISPRMRDAARMRGIHVFVPPKRACLTRGQIADLKSIFC